jgi:tetratricopeptide (TPR) repeat protein
MISLDQVLGRAWCLIGLIVLCGTLISETSAQGDVIADALKGVSGQPAASEPDLSLQAILTIDFATGRYDEAVARLEPLSHSHANNPRVWFVLGAVQLQRRAWIEAISAAERAIQIQPGWLQAHLLKAMALMGAGHRDEATHAFNRVVEIAPDDPMGYYQRALFVINSGEPSPSDLRRAMADLEQARKRGAPTAEVLTPLGLVHQKLQAPRQAEESFRRALRENPTDLIALGEYVALCDQAGRIAEANERLAEAVARVSARAAEPEALAQLALIQARHAIATKARAETIEAAFRHAIALVPGQPISRFEFSNWLDQQGRTHEAIPLLKEGLRHPPFDPDLAANLAWALAEAGTIADLDEARHWLRVAQEREPNSPHLADTSAWIEHRAGDDAKAFEALRPALPLADQLPEVAYHAGAILAGLGRRDEAIPYLRQALASGQSFPGIAEARSLLQSLSRPPR